MNKNNSCQYQPQVGCKKCIHSFYRECPEYQKQRQRALISPILPVKLTKEEFDKFKQRSFVYFLRDESKAKSTAAIVAIKKDKKLVKLTLSQVISAVLDEESAVDAELFYIEIKKSISGDITKLSNVLESFVDEQIARKHTVVIFCQTSSIKPSPDWI